MGDQFAWLGLLKWSLQHHDGTSPSTPEAMNAEDVEFLTKVMDSVVDEGTQMRKILLSLCKYLTVCAGTTSAMATQLAAQIDSLSKGNPPPAPTTDELLGLLDELRDIVEQIDFAGSFIKMNGLPFLLNATLSNPVPAAVRSQCLKIIATLAQNNPPVQSAALELGALSDLTTICEDSPELMPSALQALSAVIRGHHGCEEKFMSDRRSVPLLIAALDTDKAKHRSLLLLRSLLTDDTATESRVTSFATAFATIINIAHNDDDETAIGIIMGVLSKFPSTMFSYAEAIKEAARSKITANADEFLVSMWVDCLKELKRSVDAAASASSSSPPMMLTGPPN